LCDIFRHGVCHCSVWSSCCCSLLAGGQVISRLNLTWYGRPGGSAAKKPFRTLLKLTIFIYFFRTLFFSIVCLLDPNWGISSRSEWVHEPGYWYYFFALADDILAYGFILFVAIVLTSIRSYIRHKYSIQQGRCPRICVPVSDCCLSLWCPCLVASQHLRHTGNYETSSARCCSSNGLAAQTEV
jgi:hypothetical protein